MGEVEILVLGWRRDRDILTGSLRAEVRCGSMKRRRDGGRSGICIFGEDQ